MPLIGAGKREGKNDINARVDHNGLGVDLRSERPKAATIRTAVDKVLGDPSYAARVAEVRAELEAYAPFTHIEHVVEKAARAHQRENLPQRYPHNRHPGGD